MCASRSFFGHLFAIAVIMTYQIVNQLDENTWSAFVGQHPQGNIFHTPEMYHVFQQTSGYQPELWAVVGEQGQPLVLFLPVKISLKSGWMKALTTRAIVFGGVLAADTPETEDALRHLLRAYQKDSGRKPLFTEIRNVTACPGQQPGLQTVGFAYEDHLNYLIDLDHSPDEVFKRIGKRTQRNIRHGLNQGHVRIAEAATLSEVESGYALLKKTYQAAQVPLADFSLFATAFDLLAPRGMCLVTLARVEEHPAAASFELLYKDTVYGWYGGMDRSFGSYVPNELLMWHILRWGSEHNYKRYDFGGAGKPNEEYGVRDFKSKFGGELVCFGRNTWVPHPGFLTVCKWGYQLLRRSL